MFELNRYFESVLEVIIRCV